MEAVQAPFLMAAAVAAAGIAGGLAGSTLLRRRDATARRERLRKAADVRDAQEGFDAGSRLVRYATALSQRIALDGELARGDPETEAEDGAEQGQAEDGSDHGRVLP